MKRVSYALILFVFIFLLISCDEYMYINDDSNGANDISETTVYDITSLISETTVVSETLVSENTAMPETTISHETVHKDETTAKPETTAAFETTTVPETIAIPNDTLSPETTSPSVTTSTPDVSETKLRVQFITSERNNGEMATLTVVGKPNTEYTIKVYYSTRASEAQGLEKKFSDNNGVASWTWKVGANTKQGEHKIIVQGGGEKIETSFTTYY